MKNGLKISLNNVTFSHTAGTEAVAGSLARWRTKLSGEAQSSTTINSEQSRNTTNAATVITAIFKPLRPPFGVFLLFGMLIASHLRRLFIHLDNGNYRHDTPYYLKREGEPGILRI